MKIVDLSVVLDEATPVFPGDPKTRIKQQGDLQKDGYIDHYISMITHVGTHIDAPSHMVEGGKNLDQFPAGRFVGRGVYIKVEDNNLELAAVKGMDIREGDIVLFHTGRDAVYHEAEYFSDHPVIPEEVASYLVEKKIKMVGFDMCSPDQPPYDTHKVFLGGDVLIVENLTNLAELAGKDFTVYALPVRLQLDGAPARVIAQVQE